MIRFRCGQCGHRIAVHKRQLGALIVCPDCSSPTHPIAEQVAKHRAVGKPATGIPTAGTHTCANCSQMIGRLQKLHLWDNHVVCHECHRRLSGESAVVATATDARSVSVSVARRPLQTQLIEDNGSGDPVLQTLTRPFRGGLFGALVGLCVAGAALYGATSLLKDVAGIVTGLAIGGLALLLIYIALRTTIIARREPVEIQNSQRLRITQKPV